MIGATAGFYFEPLGDHDRATFCCGVETLDRYLKERASQDARRHAAAPFVLVTSEAKHIAGYYTLSATSLKGEDLPLELVKKLKLPRYPTLPATLIGRLARDQNYRGQGIGELLMVDALRRSWEMSLQIASMAVIVEAKDERATVFYSDFGFMAFPNSRARLFLPMATIGKSFFNE